MKNQTKITTELFLYGLIFILAAALRLILLGRTPLVETEASWAYQAWQIWQGESIRPGSLISYLSITKALFSIFGSGDIIARVWPALAGSSVIWVSFIIRDRLGRIPALILAAGLAIDPALVSLSRFAGSPVPALVFTLLAVVTFHHHKFKWSLIFLFLGVFSGPAFWMGAVVLGITLLLSSTLKILDAKQYFQTRILDIQKDRKSPLPGAWEFFLPALVVVGIGSFFFTQFQGLSAWITSFPEFLSGWISPSGVSSYKILAALIISNPLIIIFGGLGFISAWRNNDRIGKICALWFGVSLLLVLIYPGRQTEDLIWVVVPLWTGAVKELVRIGQAVEFSWVTNTLSGMTAVLFVLNWLTFTGMILKQGNQKAILMQWGLIAASIALVLLAMTIVASEWGWPSAKKGLTVGLSGVLGIYLLSALAQGAYLQAGDPNSLWTKGSGSGQIDLLLDTIAEVSVAETGRQDSIQGAVINGNSSLKWALRDLEKFEFYEVYNPGIATPVLITREIDNLQVPLTFYRGQDFVIATNPAGSAIFPEDWISWIAFRDGPIETEDIILWVRHDILPGGENSSGEN
ncbi:MAG: hypothetical protein GQ562_01305 [Anaerolineales bacterium]|nr:hypothetical protein [Anaerolineales bacterium]